MEVDSVSNTRGKSNSPGLKPSFTRPWDYMILTVRMAFSPKVPIVRVQDRLTTYISVLIGAFAWVHICGLLYIISHGFIAILVDLVSATQAPLASLQK